MGLACQQVHVPGPKVMKRAGLQLCRLLQAINAAGQLAVQSEACRNRSLRLQQALARQGHALGCKNTTSDTWVHMAARFVS